jgi:hypothetical protein
MTVPLEILPFSIAKIAIHLDAVVCPIGRIREILSSPSLLHNEDG